MAKVSAFAKNNRRKAKVAKWATKRAALKQVVMDKSLPIEERFAAQQKLSSLPLDGAKNRIRNRCEITGRPRGYYRKCGLSRIIVREYGGRGEIPGLIKSSW